MKVVVIPDVHLKPWLFDCAESILKKGKADRAVCLMDIPDDWGMESQRDRYIETYDRAIAFAKTHPDTLWCYGNHDISYLWEQLESGYSFYAAEMVIDKLNELKNALEDVSRLTFVHRIDNVLFAHGGLTASFVKRLDEKLMDADIDEVISAANNAPQGYLWTMLRRCGTDRNMMTAVYLKAIFTHMWLGIHRLKEYMKRTALFQRMFFLHIVMELKSASRQ